MEKKKKEIRLRINTLKKALQTLEKILKETYSLIIRDATIQRFEYTFELTWKLLQKIALQEGLDSPSPRQSIRQAFSLGLIKEIDPWFKFLEYRNCTSHTYNQMIAKSVFSAAKKFPKEVRRLLEQISEKYGV